MKGAEKETAAQADVPFWYLAWRMTQATEAWLKLPLASLAATWGCTSRQARRRLADLQHRGLIRYQPGQGRGNLTKIEFTTALRDEVLHLARTLAARNQAPALIRLLQQPMSPALRWETGDVLRQVLGWQQSVTGRDVFRSIWRGDLPPIDPRYCFLTFTAHVVGQLGDTLLRSDSQTGEVRPHLAHHHETPDAGQTWTLHLRKGVRFHHGRELVAHDVVHTFRRFQNSDANYGFLLQDLTDMTALNPYTVRIKLAHSNLFFPRFLTNVALVILPAEIPFDEHVWTASGPFRLSSRTAESLRFRANDDYFLGRPLLDEVEIMLVPKAGTEELSLYKGEASPGDLQHRELEQGVTYLLATGRPGGPMHNRALRRVIAGLFDLERMWTDLGRDLESVLPATSFLPHRSSRGFRSPVDVQALLNESEYEGQPLKLLYLGKGNCRHFQEAQWLQSEALKWGITLDIAHWAFEDVFAQTGPTEDADLILCNETFASDLHLSFIAALKDTNLAFRQVLPLEILASIDDQLRVIQAQDCGGRERLMGELEGGLLHEGWVTFLYHRVSTFYHSPLLQGLGLHSFGEADWRTLWFRSPEAGALISELA